jgi:two-component system response regulator QseB
MKILLLEDDLMLGKTVKSALENENNIVDWVVDAASCEAALATTKFEILLLDLGLPDKSGIEVLKKIRLQKKSIPILILTAYSSVLKKIEGLDAGADDYLTKPFDLDELMARIRSLVRRNNNVTTSIITHCDIKLDVTNHQVTQAGNTIDLTPKEFTILKIFFEKIGKVVEKSYLEEILYSWDNAIESNTVEVNIHNLRKKLGKDLIKTIRGVGYIVK